MFDKLAKHGTLLVVVDQPAAIGALPIAVTRACGHEVAYLPGLAMRRIADLYPGRAKTDARDAFVIADAARSLPHTLRRVDVGDDALAELDVLVGFDDDLTGEATRIGNRIRGLLTGVHPALERAIGPRNGHPAVMEILSRCGGPTGIATAGRRKLSPRSPPRIRPGWATHWSPRSWPHWTSRPSVVPGTTAADTALPRLADSLTSVLLQCEQVATEVEGILDAQPRAGVLTSMPGVGVGTAARILLGIGDATGFTSSGHLAAYAGFAPVTRSSGSSIKGEHPARRRQPRTQTGVLPRRVRGLVRHHQQGLLPTKTRRMEVTQCRADLPGPTPLRCPVRHAPQQDPLPAPRDHSHPACGLTTT
ncbi:IS110 family transposase [Actinoalloteichus sp. AHMU CJ021]|uniref:IS110 family transposase n=1 Tax=Actinoalloteichus sp. AHMU CJ021 TaxID=2072503 RepID=UPI00307B4715